MKIPNYAKDISVISLVASNLIILLGVLILKENIFRILYIYGLQLIIIGLFTIPKIFIAKKKIKIDKPEKMSYIDKLIYSPLGLKIISVLKVLYVGTVWIFSYIFTVYLITYRGGRPSIEIPWNQAFESFYNFYLLVFFVLLLNHGISFYSNFIVKKEFNKFSYVDIRDSFLSRVGLMSLASVIMVYLFGYLSIKTNSPEFYFTIILVIVKIYFDVRGHLKEHNPI